MTSPKIKLVDYGKDLCRGSILRCKATLPYEDLVDFMLIEAFGEDEKMYALLVSTGYKSGLIFCKLPVESIPTGNTGYAVSLQWLIDNWATWGYSDCPLDEVYIIEGDHI